MTDDRCIPWQFVVSRDFSPTPGGRTRASGPHSAEEMRDAIVKRWKECGGKIEVILDDNCAGFASSFLEEVFGGIVRHHGKKYLDGMTVTCSHDHLLLHEVLGYVREALDEDTRDEEHQS